MDLRRAERLVEADAEMLGEVPVLRGTRIPLHTLSQGETSETLSQVHPPMTDEMIRLAPIYACAHPLHGRPRKGPRAVAPNAACIAAPLSDAAASRDFCEISD
jgi:hypothetical protein